MAWNFEFPYTDSKRYNDDWLLRTIKELIKEIENFVNLNTIKYADPIEWDITRQYEANTVVVDARTGNAYISTHAVPAGVQINNTEYWTQIYNYADIIDTVREQIATNEGDVTTASQRFNVGDWVFVSGLLYEVIAPMIAGDSFVEDSNVKKVTIEELVKALITALGNKIGDLDNLSTEDKTNLVAAINEVLSDLTSTVGDLDNLSTEDKTNLVAAINEVLTKLISTVGDLDDLSTEDKTNLVAAINEVLSKIPRITTAGILGLIPNDNTAGATNSALLNAALAQHKVVLLDENVYYIDSAVVLSNKSGIVGTSRRGSVLKTVEAINMIEVPVTFTDNISPYWDVFLSNFSLEGAYRTTLSGLHIYNYTYEVTCNSDFSAYVALKGDAYALELRGAPINNLYIQAPNDGINIGEVIAECAFDNIFIETCYNTGIKTAAYDSLFSNINVTYCNTGVYNTGGDVKWSNCKIYQNGRRINNYSVDYTSAFGIYFEGANRNQLVNFQVEENGGVGAVFKDCKSLMLDINVDANGFVTSDINYKIGIEFLGTCVDISGRISATDKNTEMFGSTTQRIGIYIDSTSAAFDVEYTEYGNALKYYAAGLHTVSLLKTWKTFFRSTTTLGANVAHSAGDPDFASYDGEFLNIILQCHTTSELAVNDTVVNVGRPDMTDPANVYNCPSYIPITILDSNGDTYSAVMQPNGDIKTNAVIPTEHTIFIRDSIKLYY